MRRLTMQGKMTVGGGMSLKPECEQLAEKNVPFDHRAANKSARLDFRCDYTINLSLG
jgi:hypothetical protein